MMKLRIVKIISLFNSTNGLTCPRAAVLCEASGDCMGTPEPSPGKQADGREQTACLPGSVSAGVSGLWLTGQE